MNKKIAISLSTYNGEKYLNESYLDEGKKEMLKDFASISKKNFIQYCNIEGQSFTFN